MYSLLSGFADLWGPAYVSEAWGIDKKVAGGMVSTFYVGVALGGPAFAWFSDFTKSHKKAMVVSPIVTVIAASLLFFFPHMFPENTLYFCFPILGLLSSGQFLCFVAVSSLNPKSATATASGFHNMLCMLSGVIFQPFMGWIMDFSAGGDSANIIHGLKDYQWGLSSIVVCLVVAFFMTRAMPETYGTSTK